MTDYPKVMEALRKALEAPSRHPDDYVSEYLRRPLRALEQAARDIAAAKRLQGDTAAANRVMAMIEGLRVQQEGVK